MANPNLSSATSIVDYLNTKGSDSSFGARKKLYNDLGFNKMGGEFVGSSSQNLNLLKRLQTQDNPPKATDVISANMPPVNPAPATPTASSFMVNQAKTPLSSVVPGFDLAKAPTPSISSITPPSSVTNTSTPQASDVLARAGLPSAPTVTTTTPIAPAGPTLPATPTAQQATTTQSPSKTVDTTTAQTTGGISASSIYPDIFGKSGNSPSNSSEADVVNTWLNSAEGQAFINRQNIKEMNATAKNEAVKAELEAKFASDKATLENNLAAHGLAFSGIRASKVRALAAALAASELGADRDLAAALLDSDADLRDAIIKGVADLAKDAADGRKEAIQQLNSIGYAVIGDKLVPTLAAQSAARAEHASEVADRRLQLAEEAAVRAEKQFEANHGAGKTEFFKNVQTLIDKAPGATEQDIKLAIRANPEVFGEPSEAEITDAISLVGMPPAIRDSVAVGTVKANFIQPHLSRLLPGDQTQEAFDAAIKAAKDALANSGGQIEVDDGGKTKTYKLTTSQLSDLIEAVGTVTLEEVNSAP